MELAVVRYTWEWRIAFLILAVRRAVPLWVEAGLPRALAARPDDALGTAREFLLGSRELEGEPEASRTELLERSIDRLRSEYGDHDADDVVRWAVQYFVGDEHRVWSIWYSLFSDLATVPPGELQAPVESLPLGVDRRSFVRRTILARMSTESYRTMKASLARAESIPLSQLEAQLLAPDLRLFGPGETPHGPPLLDYVQGAISGHRAHAVWAELDRSLSHNERAVLVEWAQARARRVGPSVRYIGWPKAMFP